MAAWPTVVTALSTRVKAVLPSSVQSLRGSSLSQASGDAVFVALQNMEDDLDWTLAGTLHQEMQSFGGARLETGTVNCLVLARDGGSDLNVTTTNAAGYLAALEADVRADPTLGITDSRFDYVKAEMDSGEIRELLATDGASTALPFVISYDIRIK